MSRLRILGLLSLGALPLAAHADDLGIANGFNVFVFGSMQSHGSDTQGRIAVGGNATLASYSVGHNYAGATVDTLVVGGALNFSNGSVENGKYWAGGAVSFTNASGVRDTASTSPIDFLGAEADLLQKSDAWSGLSDSGSKTINPYNGGITLSGMGPLSVFTVTATEFAASHNATVINAAAGSTVLINVSGLSVQLGNAGYVVNGSNVNVLYNFYEATSLKFSGSPMGTLLAPKANVQFNNGALYGSLIAKNLNVGLGAYQDSGQFDQHLFGGNLPSAISTDPSPVSPVPAPAALAVVGLNSAAMAFRRRRKAK